MKLSMIEISNKIDWVDVKLSAQVHDELLLEAPEDVAEDVLRMVEKEMIAPGEKFNFRVPLKAEGKVGKTWWDVH